MKDTQPKLTNQKTLFRALLGSCNEPSGRKPYHVRISHELKLAKPV